MLLGTHILTTVQQFVPQLATWNLCLYIGIDIVCTILDCLVCSHCFIDAFPCGYARAHVRTNRPLHI